MTADQRVTAAREYLGYARALKIGRLPVPAVDAPGRRAAPPARPGPRRRSAPKPGPAPRPDGWASLSAVDVQTVLGALADAAWWQAQHGTPERAARYRSLSGCSAMTGERRPGDPAADRRRGAPRGRDRRGRLLHPHRAPGRDARADQLAALLLPVSVDGTVAAASCSMLWAAPIRPADALARQGHAHSRRHRHPGRERGYGARTALSGELRRAGPRSRSSAPSRWCSGWSGDTRRTRPVPDEFASLNGHAAAAAELFAADLEAGRVPGIRAIRSGLHVGQDKASRCRRTCVPGPVPRHDRGAGRNPSQDSPGAGSPSARQEITQHDRPARSRDPNAEVAVPEPPELLAVPADTSYEIELDDRPQSPATPVYADISPPEGARLPVIPKHLQSLDGLKAAGKRHAGRQVHRAGYHGIRTPKYLLLALCWAVVGLFRARSAGRSTGGGTWRRTRCGRRPRRPVTPAST